MEEEFLPLKVIVNIKRMPIYNSIFEMMSHCNKMELGEVNILGN